MLERRKLSRIRTLKPGTINFNRAGAISCVVRNLFADRCLEIASQSESQMTLRQDLIIRRQALHRVALERAGAPVLCIGHNRGATWSRGHACRTGRISKCVACASERPTPRRWQCFPAHVRWRLCSP
jgi:hypothetical protein